MAATSDLIARTFEIRSGQRRVQIAADHVYFTFGDGRLSYDCIRCGSKCCRGYGYNLNGATEVQYQISSRPYARFFLNAVPNDPVVGMNNCPPGCFFLNDEGLCGIHVEHGYDAKPETCRLFPFNAFSRVGDYLIVSPHPELCPLEVMPAGSRSPASDHRSLLDSMGFRGIASEVTLVRAIVPDPDRAIDLERRIAALSDTFLDPAVGTFEEFIDNQFAITRDDVEGNTHCEGEIHQRNSVHASTLIGHAERLLGVDLREACSGDPNVDRTIIAFTPYLRSQFVFVRESRNRSDSGVAHVALDRVPGMVLGVYVMARLAALAGMPNVTFQTATRLLNTYGALIWCLAHAEDVMAWGGGTITFPTGARLRPFVIPYVRVIRDLLPSRQRKSERSLVEILCEHNVWNGAERIAFLNFVGSHLARLVVSQHERAPAKKVEKRLRSSLQRCILNRVPDDVLEQACRRLADRAARAGF